MKSPKVLIVDDEPRSLEMIKAMLAPMGLAVMTESQSIRVVDRIRRDLPDVVILDICMPGIDGVEIGKLMKSDKSTRNIPVIFVTGMQDVSSHVRAVEAGCVGYVKKPLNMSLIRACVRNALNIKKNTDELEARIERIREQYMTTLKNRENEVTIHLVSGDSPESKPASRPALVEAGRAVLGNLLAGNQEISNNDDQRSADYHTPLFGINSVAGMTGIEPNCIRAYERRGLIRPYRNPENNYRVFTRSEVEWLRTVDHLIHREGLNIRGILRILQFIPCWEVLKCPEKSRNACPVFLNPDNHLPCWARNPGDFPCGRDQCFDCPYHLSARARLETDEPPAQENQ